MCKTFGTCWNCSLNLCYSLAMDGSNPDESDEDFLIELLSYQCPRTGQKRVAGLDNPCEAPEEKRMKSFGSKSNIQTLLCSLLMWACDVSTFSQCFTAQLRISPEEPKIEPGFPMDYEQMHMDYFTRGEGCALEPRPRPPATPLHHIIEKEPGQCS